MKTLTEPRFEAAAGHRSWFLTGLVGGALIGTAAGVLFAPQINAALRNIRRQLTDAAAGASDAAAETYREATTRVGDAVDDLQQKGRAVYGKALSAVGTRRGGCQRAGDRGPERTRIKAPPMRRAARHETRGQSS